MNDLRLVRVQQPDNQFKDLRGPYVEPVHLQVVCKSLWDMPDRVDPKRITSADLCTLGGGEGLVGVGGVLARYYKDRLQAAAWVGVLIDDAMNATWTIALAHNAGDAY